MHTYQMQLIESMNNYHIQSLKPNKLQNFLTSSHV